MIKYFKTPPQKDIGIGYTKLGEPYPYTSIWCYFMGVLWCINVTDLIEIDQGEYDLAMGPILEDFNRKMDEARTRAKDIQDKVDSMKYDWVLQERK
jgi:hypothetical protein